MHCMSGRVNHARSCSRRNCFHASDLFVQCQQFRFRWLEPATTDLRHNATPPPPPHPTPNTPLSYPLHPLACCLLPASPTFPPSQRFVQVVIQHSLTTKPSPLVIQHNNQPFPISVLPNSNQPSPSLTQHSNQPFPLSYNIATSNSFSHTKHSNQQFPLSCKT